MNSLLPQGTADRPWRNLKTFDVVNPRIRAVASIVTLDTRTRARSANPVQIYYALKSNIDRILAFGQVHSPSHDLIAPSAIASRELNVAIPEGTTAAQWEQIERAISYARAISNSVVVKVTVVK